MLLIPFFGPDGQTRHVLAVVRDITARKRAEAARREFEARIAQSRKMEALGQLAGGVAHDFNNILTGILGFADVIGRSTTDAAAAGFSGEIIQAASRRVTWSARSSCSAAGNPRTPPGPPYGGGTGGDQAHPRTAPAAINIRTLAPDDAPYILGDATQLHQVVMNLCTNAIQAMGDEGGELSVAVEPIEVSAEFARQRPPLREGMCVRLSVRDSGPGMPQLVLDRLFEPFFTTKAPGVGTGLGLSVVHGVVQNHEGAVVVKSRPGEGTNFDVYLPAINSPSWSGDVIVTDKQTLPAGKRVLFVDDEASIARLAQVMLKGLGHATTTCTTPAEGLERFRSSPTEFDVVITDLTMPGMTGVELARGIRQISADVPIVLSSGYADEVPEEMLRSLGIVEVLPKPFQMQTLGGAINPRQDGHEVSEVRGQKSEVKGQR